MPEFLHEVVKKREREQEHRNLTPNNYLTELHRQMQESYNRMTSQALIPPTVAATRNTSSTTVTYNRGAISQLFGMVYVRSRSYNAVDEYIRRNAEAHNNWFNASDTAHTHGDTQRWVLDEVSSVYGGRRQFTYSCYECGTTCLAGESIRREEVVNGG